MEKTGGTKIAKIQKFSVKIVAEILHILSEVKKNTFRIQDVGQQQKTNPVTIVGKLSYDLSLKGRNETLLEITMLSYERSNWIWIVMI